MLVGRGIRGVFVGAFCCEIVISLASTKAPVMIPYLLTHHMYSLGHFRYAFVNFAPGLPYLGI